ncbi:ion channel [Larkinella soli]|uniref:ion channel n=1 Tax=Larkinella soli TaxID=1770527 RepID=UPI000FFBE889|nr:ion channel [Larkinella soli]
MKQHFVRPAERRLGTKRSSTLVEQEEKRPDLGFGTRLNGSYSRMVNKDGSFNVRRINGSFLAHLNLYHRLITMSWPKFFLTVAAAFFVVNILFANVYYLLGPGSLVGIQAENDLDRFWEDFFFSAQTLTTVGYGRISPVGIPGSSVAALESLIGLLSFALATGLLYGRFSRPTPRIRFSRNALFAPYLDVNAWMFRIINERSNQLVDIEIDVSMSRLEAGKDGQPARKYYGLSLERRKVAFFPTNWTLVHPITEDSPLFQCSPESLKESDTEFLIILRAIDDTFSQMVHLRYSYRFDEILWGHKFRPMFSQVGQDIVTVDLKMLDETEEVPLN